MLSLSMNIELIVSIVNTYLRDKYDNLESLCEEENLDFDRLISILCENAYFYDQKINQIKQK